MIYEVGDRVIVCLDPNEQIHSIHEVWDYQGHRYMIKAFQGAGDLSINSKLFL